jgi:hypothetical protein
VYNFFHNLGVAIISTLTAFTAHFHYNNAAPVPTGVVVTAEATTSTVIQRDAYAVVGKFPIAKNIADNTTDPLVDRLVPIVSSTSQSSSKNIPFKSVAPMIKITSQTSDETWSTARSYKVSWESANVSGSIIIGLAKSNGGGGCTIDNFPVSDGSAVLNISSGFICKNTNKLLEQGEYYVHAYIEVKDDGKDYYQNTQSTGMINVVFNETPLAPSDVSNLDNKPKSPIVENPIKEFNVSTPTLVIIDPGPNDIVIAGNTYTIKWQSTGGLNNFTLFYISEDDYQRYLKEEAVKVGAISITGVSGANGSYNWHVPLNLLGKYRLLITYYTGPGGNNLRDYSETYFTVN